MKTKELHKLIDGTLLKQQLEWCETARLSTDEVIKMIDELSAISYITVEVENNNG